MEDKPRHFQPASTVQKKQDKKKLLDLIDKDIVDGKYKC